jgi:hypothetical protein
MSEKKSDLDQAVFLLSQVIEKSEIDDTIESAENPRIARGGDGWITRHLKLVKELLEEHKNAEN